MASEQITVELILDLDQLKAKLGEAKSVAESGGKAIGDKLGESSEGGLGGLAKAAGAVGATIAATVAVVVGAALALKGMVSEAMEAGEATNHFNASLRVAGNFTQAASEDFQKYAESLQKVTTVSDNVILKNAGILASLGKLSGQGLKDATKAALDFAAGAGIGTEQAFDLMAKAATGNTEALGRYGIKVTETGDKTKDFNLVLNKVRDTFGGMAESETATFGGAIEQLKNSFGNMLGEMGKLITESPLVIGGIRGITTAVEWLSEKVKAFISLFRTQAAEAAEIAGSAVKKVVDDGSVTWAAFVSSMGDFKNKVKIEASQIAKIINDGIVKTPADAFAAFGGALAKGENAFEAFGKSVLRSLGQILIQFGTMLIAVGVGLSTVPMLFGLQGPAAIAAGIAAVVAGGALMAIGGGGAAGATSQAGGGGVDVGAGGQTTPLGAVGGNVAQLADKPQTTVHVNIQGNVLDRRQTGLEIADVINEVFGSNGVTFATAGA